MNRMLYALAGLAGLLALSMGLATPAVAAESFSMLPNFAASSVLGVDAGAVVLTVAFLGLTPMLMNYQPVFSIAPEGDTGGVAGSESAAEQNNGGDGGGDGDGDNNGETDTETDGDSGDTGDDSDVESDSSE